MKKRKTIFPRKSKSPGRYGLEAAILCILLLVAAYVSNLGSTTPQAAQQTSVSQKQDPTPRRETSRSDKFTRVDAAAKASKNAGEVEYRLVRAADGDSFELKDEKNRRVRVRLYGVDAPEGNQRFGRESREHLLGLLKNRTLRLKTLFKDSYQRLVAIVYLSNKGSVDELSINQRQVQSGLAWVYDYFCTSDICNTWKLEEAMARKQKLGLWEDPSPVPPWEWRRQRKNR